jgi:murein DD-endopeptidase MepM/ murein hydrolase activator NlpD
LFIHGFTNVYLRSRSPWQFDWVLKIALIFTLLVLNSATAAAPPPSPLETQDAASWQLPFMTPHRLFRPYLQPQSDYSAGHRGVDFVVKFGENLYAPADGVVSFAGQLVNRAVLTIRHGSGIVTEFEPACASLPIGSTVFKGEIIGTVCAPNAGYLQHCSQDNCLHFSMRVDGKYLSPLALIGGLSPSRLLPQARG